MKKFIYLVALLFPISLSTFASNNLPTENQEVLVTKDGKEIELDKETLDSYTYCGSGYVVDSNGNVIGDWFYCDSFNGDGSFVFRITIW
jgi:hypothetical protein